MLAFSFQVICRWKQVVIAHSARTLRAYFATNLPSYLVPPPCLWLKLLRAKKPRCWPSFFCGTGLDRKNFQHSHFLSLLLQNRGRFSSCVHACCYFRFLYMNTCEVLRYINNCGHVLTSLAFRCDKLFAVLIQSSKCLQISEFTTFRKKVHRILYAFLGPCSLFLNFASFFFFVIFVSMFCFDFFFFHVFAPSVKCALTPHSSSIFPSASHFCDLYVISRLRLDFLSDVQCISHLSSPCTTPKVSVSLCQRQD